MPSASQPLSQTTFVVADTETTGVSAAADRIIEVGAVKMRGGQVLERFSELVNPGRSVPRRITQITGITTAALVDAPPIAEVLPRFRAFLGDHVLVGHNLPFDIGFLDAEAARLGIEPMDNPTLCTLKLARRILRGHRSKGLGAVADFYGIRIVGRHRALGDAEATAQVLDRFIAHLGFSEDIDTLDALRAYQSSRYRKGGEPRHLKKIRTRLAEVPATPGVYFMKDAGGAVVYVGKARSLKSRVKSYFTSIEAHPPRLRKLVETVRDVEWKETGSELSALLLESRLIKEMQPSFNRAARRYRSRPFIRLDAQSAFPRVSVAPYILDDGAEYYGPLAGRKQAEIVREVIDRFFTLRECDDAAFAHGQKCLYHTMGRCLGPCAEPDVSYAAEVKKVRDFLLGRDTDTLDALKTAMTEAAARREYELAGQYRDWYRALETMRGKQQQVAASVLDHHGVIVQPGEAEGTRQCYAIRYGRHVETLTLDVPLTEVETLKLRAWLDSHFAQEPPRPERYLKREIDEIRVLSHWLYVHRDSAQQVPFVPGMPVADYETHVRAALSAAEETPDEEE